MSRRSIGEVAKEYVESKSVITGKKNVYIKESKLTSGSDGNVYIVKTPIGMEFIMKTESDRKRHPVKKEISFLTELADSPAVINLYDSYPTPDKRAPSEGFRIFMVVEKMTNSLEIFHPSSEEDLLEIIRLAIEGLMDIHARKVVHQDISKANIMLDFEPNIDLKYIDFARSARFSELSDEEIKEKVNVDIKALMITLRLLVNFSRNIRPEVRRSLVRALKEKPLGETLEEINAKTK